VTGSQPHRALALSTGHPGEASRVPPAGTTAGEEGGGMIRTRPCYHNIDKPILVLGLEYQDWALVLVFFLVFIVLPVCSNLSVVVLTIVCGGLLRLVKRGKPPGTCGTASTAGVCRCPLCCHRGCSSTARFTAECWPDAEKTPCPGCSITGRILSAPITACGSGFGAWWWLPWSRAGAWVGRHRSTSFPVQRGQGLVSQRWLGNCRAGVRRVLCADPGELHPQTARKSYEAALRYLAPEALSRAQSGLAAELERIQRDRISSQFALTGK